MLLKDKVAVITGGAGPNGLGFATAKLMAQHGARVAVLDLAGAEPAAAAAKLGDGPLGAHLGLVADVTDKASCDAAIAAVLKAFGRIDVLVNNAGITQPRKTVDITNADYDAVLDVSLRGTLLMSQAVIPTMQRQRGGSIVCISSVSAQRVNCITPGLIQTDIQMGKLSEERKAEIAKDIPLGRLGVTADVAGACLYLASDLSSYCTGITLDVNGGMLIH
jgi:NAD(P)-dependent dehydrogenase (short-subunit alcohol dehydrogenase family)